MSLFLHSCCLASCFYNIGSFKGQVARNEGVVALIIACERIRLHVVELVCLNEYMSLFLRTYCIASCLFTFICSPKGRMRQDEEVVALNITCERIRLHVRVLVRLNAYMSLVFAYIFPCLWPVDG